VASAKSGAAFTGSCTRIGHRIGILIVGRCWQQTAGSVILAHDLRPIDTLPKRRKEKYLIQENLSAVV
jgi:hypothetical protein